MLITRNVLERDTWHLYNLTDTLADKQLVKFQQSTCSIYTCPVLYIWFWVMSASA
uniref:Uncharacterized protein n=1 Tax=Daphnia magna TaxID=35525 RepID=A0A0P6BPP7_9CRUS